MHDANGVPLEVGDKVTIPATVVALHAVSDFCNVDVDFDLPMPAYPDQKTRMSALNTRQIIKDPGPMVGIADGGVGPVVQHLHKHSNGDETPVFAHENRIGQHRQHCLCYECHHLMKPDGSFRKKGACGIAKKLYRFVVKHSLVTPVFECPHFVPVQQIIPAPKG